MTRTFSNIWAAAGDGAWIGRAYAGICTTRLDPEFTTRNLIYHVMPFQDTDIWLRNIRQILKRIHLFNGRRVVAVATGEDLLPLEAVRDAFGKHAESIEFLCRQNSKVLRENATFLPLLECVASAEPNEATFYAHTKGVRPAGDATAVMYWRNAMYHELLDDWDRIAELLAGYATVGAFRRHHAECLRIYPDGHSESPWHFSGTYFWFRNRDVFATDKWRRVWQPTGWGAEAWPGRMFAYEQSACVAFEGCEEPYSIESYPEPISDDD